VIMRHFIHRRDSCSITPLDKTSQTSKANLDLNTSKWRKLVSNKVRNIPSKPSFHD
jgi:hypothetical protein